MSDIDRGWDWFDGASVPSAGEALKPDRGLALSFAKCFRGQDGERVLKYLRSLTVERALGPETADGFLRHVEGQRQLVAHITALIDRGHGATHGE